MSCCYVLRDGNVTEGSVAEENLNVEYSNDREIQGKQTSSGLTCMSARSKIFIIFGICSTN
jgi:hypothetical protein